MRDLDRDYICWSMFIAAASTIVITATVIFYVLTTLTKGGGL